MEQAQRMLNYQSLLKELNVQSELLEVKLGSNFDFTQKEYAYVIEGGSVLVTGEKNSQTGLFPTHTLEAHDPIGFAEAIVARPIGLRLQQKSDVKLRKFNSFELREFVARANVFSKTIIKYSIGRILGLPRGASTFAFEEEFIDKNYKLLIRRVVTQDEAIFTIGATAAEMFFIESGSVRITSNENKVMANLGVGGCFGESALFDDRLRTNQVIATSETNLLVINREQVEREVNKEPPIVRLIVLLLIKRLEIMNTLRMRDYW